MITVENESHKQKRTRLEEIALEYVERYWSRLHIEDRIALLRATLTNQEWHALRQDRDSHRNNNA